MQSTGWPRIQLTIRRTGDLNAVQLDAGGPLIHESVTHVEEALLHGLVTQVTQVATPPAGLEGTESRRRNEFRRHPSPTLCKLQAIGEQLFSHLLPQPAREQLCKAAHADLCLQVDEQLIQVPWELCHDGTDFLATKFRIGRQLRIAGPLPWPETVRNEPGLLKVLLVADPTESLPQAAQEAEHLCHLLDRVPQVKVTLLGGKWVGKAALLTALQAHDVVHFAGHSHYDPLHPSRSGWHLQAEVVTAEDLRQLRRPPFLVFSNSCQAGAMGGGRYQYDRQAFGLGRAFLFAGVRNYIGTFWVVHDEESREFALRFYQGVATGLSLGAALVQARLALRSQSGGERLTWASYMLYGDPAVTLFPAVAESPPLSPLGGSERKLVAILSADVQGYSRLMGEDELATVHTLTAHRAVMTTLIEQYHGEVIDTPGDNLLALFPSVVGAVQCAVEIQQELKLRNAPLPAHRQMAFRIGLNLGDIIVHANEVHGEGINIAARLERLAEPGGICLSGVVYEQVKNTLALRCEALGAKVLKNIKNPVPVFRVVLGFALPPPYEKKGSKTQAVIVRPFKVLKTAPQQAWLKDNEAIPHRLTSALSHLPGLTVYPAEHFEWLLQRCHLSELELARALGIAKVIRGSFLVAGSTCRIEAHLEDVENIVHEPSAEVQGEVGDFFQLIDALALKIASRLNLTPEAQLGIPAAPSPPGLDLFPLMIEDQEFMAWHPFDTERPQ